MLYSSIPISGSMPYLDGRMMGKRTILFISKRQYRYQLAVLPSVSKKRLSIYIFAESFYYYNILTQYLRSSGDYTDYLVRIIAYLFNYFILYR